MNNDPNDPSRYRRLGRNHVDEQRRADDEEDRPWTIYALLGIAIMILIVLVIVRYL